MMEGITYEAASLAGTLGLNKLIWLYDKNNITIEGGIDAAFREDVGKRHEAMGWNVLTVEDGEDYVSVGNALALAKTSKRKPTLIIVRTQIGYGSPLAGKADCHGAPLKDPDLKATRQAFGYKTAPFEMSADVKEHFARLGESGVKAEEDYKKLLRDYRKKYPDLAEELARRLQNKPPDLSQAKELYDFKKADATRSSSGAVLNWLAKLIPNLVGGSADLAPSTKTELTGAPYVSAEAPAGRNIHFGVREHAMAAVCNGLYLHGGFFVYCSTFFSFFDYMKPAVRLSALMDIPVIYVFTHDSIGVGEDGPTHQPVEQLAALRSIPNLKTFRPCDGRETAAAYQSALSGTAPTAIVLTRQTLPLQPNSSADALKGAYILAESKKETPDVILMASGSEVDLTVKAREVLRAKYDIDARVISVPCMEAFDRQPAKYREQLLPDAVRARLAVEAGSSMCWHRYTGIDGDVVGIDNFGMSGPADKLFEIYGLTVDNVVDKAVKVCRKAKKSGIQSSQNEV
jgi:transketolase